MFLVAFTTFFLEGVGWDICRLLACVLVIMPRALKLRSFAADIRGCVSLNGVMELKKTC